MTIYLFFLIRIAYTFLNVAFLGLHYYYYLYLSIEMELFNFSNSIFSTEFVFVLLKYCVIPLLVLTIFSFVILLIYNRFDFERKIKIKTEIDIKTDDFLTDLIFSNYSVQTIKNKISKFKKELPFKKMWCKDLILNKIITIKQNINGVDSNRILIIYKSFEFHHYSKKLISNRSWRKKLLGIYHYQVLEYKIKTGYIRPYLNTKFYINKVKNRFLNSNALIAMIILSDEKFEILNNYDRKISKADELKLLDIIYHKKSVLPTKIDEWLHNPNFSIVTLAIKLMVRYREILKDYQINHLLSLPSTAIHKETLLAIRFLYIIESNDLLINYYKNETDKRNKISTLKTLGVIGNEETRDFVFGIVFDEQDLEIKFEMVHCINSIDSTYFKDFKIEDKVENDIINRILLHVTNPYLN